MLAKGVPGGEIMISNTYISNTTPGSISWVFTLQWRHNRHDSVSNHQPYDCLLTVYSDADQRKNQSSASLAFVRGIDRGTGEFPAQMASNTENVSICWRLHEVKITLGLMPEDLIDGESTLVQVIAWCRQATSQNYLRSLTQYGVTRTRTRTKFMGEHLTDKSLNRMLAI